MKVAAIWMQEATISNAKLSVVTSADVKRQSFADSVGEPSVTEYTVVHKLLAADSVGETVIIWNAEEPLAIDNIGELWVATGADAKGLSVTDDVDEPLLPEKTDVDKTAADVVHVDEQFVICNAKTTVSHRWHR